MFPRVLTTAFAFVLLTLCTTKVFAQQADFTSDVREGCFPLTVKFNDASAGTVTSWLWDFGNGNNSTLKDPSAVFPAPGTYNVTLTVSNGGAPSTRIRSGYITVRDYPTVDFSFDKSSGCAPLTVKFNDLTSTGSGQIASWQWVFGDGGISTSANPTYVFKDPGSRIVTLRVKNEYGCEKVKSATSPITVNGPVTKFAVDKTAVCTTPATFQFTNQTTGTNLSYQWTFGDGQTSTATSPSHTYNSAGVFNVVLKAKDGNGCETTFSKTVNAGSEGDLDFNASSLRVCLNEPVDFTLISTDAAVTALWNFGDGNTSTSTNEVQHSWTAPGTYTISLNASLLNHTCNSIISKTIFVAPPATPSFTQSVDCDYNLKLTSTSQNAARLEWFVNNEFISGANTITSPVHAPGGQEIRLIAYDAAGCSKVLETIVSMPANPAPAFTPIEQQSCIQPSLSGCAPFNVKFENKTPGNDITSIKWEFGDGGTSTADKPEHTYVNKGLFQVSLTAANSRGCSKTAIAFVIVENQAPIADFVIDKNVACAGEEVKFTDKSTGADFWCWDFGDGGKDTGKEVIYKYGKPGTYSVTLYAKNAGCTTTKTIVNVITIKDPYVNFTLQKNCGDPYAVALTNLSEHYDVIEWDFGDGQTSSNVNVGSHRYDNEGTYTLRLIGTNNTTNCTTIAFQPIIIQDIDADFTMNTDKPCKDAPLSFTDQSHAPFKWEWTIGTTKYVNQNPSTKFPVPGDYSATLKVTDSDGCSSTKIKPFTVVDMQGEFNFLATSNCEEFTVLFDNESFGNPNPTNWLWTFGDGQTSTDKDPEHVYHTPGKYNVALSVTNAQGTCVFTKENAINFTVPIPGFQTAKHTFCPGETILVANTTRNAVFYEWDYGDGRRSDFVNAPIVYNTTGTYDISLFAKDAYGCEKKISKQEFIEINKPKADFNIGSSTGSCPPFTGVFTDKSEKDIEGWDWDFGDGHHSTIKDPANVYLTPGRFDVKLMVTDKNGCVDTKTVNQFVTVGGPTGNFTHSGANSCTNKVIAFDANVQNTAKLRWDFGDGNVVEKTDTKIDHVYTSVGSFTPQLLLIDANGCQTVAGGSQLFLIKDTTAVSMSFSPLCIATGEKFALKGKNEQDEEDLGWSWEVDGSFGTTDSYETTIDRPGAYPIRGYAVNAFGCTSHVTDTVRIQGPITLIPNVITPNSDRYNERFDIIGLENSIWNLHIVNRWGTTVYSRENYRGEWDGGEQPAGVYYFVLRNAICNDVNHKGYISLTR